MEQAALKEYMPPGAYIWKCQASTGSWCSRFPPFPEISRSIGKHTETVAIKIVIASAWQKYCISEGIRWEDCLVEGLTPYLDNP